MCEKHKVFMSAFEIFVNAFKGSNVRDEDGFMVYTEKNGLTTDKSEAFCKLCKGRGHGENKKQSKARGQAKRNCEHVANCPNVYTGE